MAGSKENYQWNLVSKMGKKKKEQPSAFPPFPDKKFK